MFYRLVDNLSEIFSDAALELSRRRPAAAGAHDPARRGAPLVLDAGDRVEHRFRDDAFRPGLSARAAVFLVARVGIPLSPNGTVVALHRDACDIEPDFDARVLVGVKLRDVNRR